MGRLRPGTDETVSFLCLKPGSTSIIGQIGKEAKGRSLNVHNAQGTAEGTWAGETETVRQAGHSRAGPWKKGASRWSLRAGGQEGAGGTPRGTLRGQRTFARTSTSGGGPETRTLTKD